MGLLAVGSFVNQRTYEARMSFVGSHKVNGISVSLLYLSLIFFSANQFLICRSSPCVITTIAPFHFGSTFFFLSILAQLYFFFRSWSFYCNLVLEWLKPKYLAQVYPKICRFQNSKNCMETF